MSVHVQNIYCAALLAEGALVKTAKVVRKLFSLLWNTSTHSAVETMTAQTGPYTGRYSGLYAPDPIGRPACSTVHACWFGMLLI